MNSNNPMMPGTYVRQDRSQGHLASLRAVLLSCKRVFFGEGEGGTSGNSVAVDDNEDTGVRWDDVHPTLKMLIKLIAIFALLDLVRLIPRV